MKSLYIISIISLAILTQQCKTAQHDSVTKAKKANDLHSIEPREVTYFLVEATDAGKMKIEAGKLATEKGITLEIREYGQLMIRDQTRLLSEIQVLASAKKIVLPKTLSVQKTSVLKELKAEKSVEFDKKFIEIMTMDHRRDLKDFETASLCKDRQVMVLASHNVPIIQSHLDKIQQFQDE